MGSMSRQRQAEAGYCKSRYTVFGQVIPVYVSNLSHDGTGDGQCPVFLEPEKNEAGGITSLVLGSSDSKAATQAMAGICSYSREGRIDLLREKVSFSLAGPAVRRP